MTPSITVRLNNTKHPDRKEKFEAVLAKRAANATDVVNNFIDAYIACDGNATFPIKFACDEDPPILKAAEAPPKYSARKRGKGKA